MSEKNRMESISLVYMCILSKQKCNLKYSLLNTEYLCNVYIFTGCHGGKHFKDTGIGGKCILEMTTVDIHKNYLTTPSKDYQICVSKKSTLL